MLKLVTLVEAFRCKRKQCDDGSYLAVSYGSKEPS